MLAPVTIHGDGPDAPTARLGNSLAGRDAFRIDSRARTESHTSPGSRLRLRTCSARRVAESHSHRVGSPVAVTDRGRTAGPGGVPGRAPRAFPSARRPYP